MSAAYTTAGETFVPAKSRQWSARQLSDAGNYSVFDVAPDGKRVVAILDETDEKTDAHLRVVLNLDHELRRKGGSK
jgi:hypothetical protein